MEDLPWNDKGLESLAKRFESDGVKPEFLTQSFLEAGDLGDANSLRARLKTLTADEKRELVRAVDQQGCSGLLLAVRRGHSEVAEVLLDAGANPNDADNSGCTVCHFASSRGSISNLKLLLAAKADPTKVDDRADTPLSWASSAEVVALLLEAGVDASARGSNGRTALMYACERGDLSSAQSLAAVPGADLNARDDAGNSAHALAIRNGHDDVADMIAALGAEASPEPAARVVLREEAMFDAARRGDADTLATLLEGHHNMTLLPEDGAGMSCGINLEVAGETPLLLACSASAGRAVDVLLHAAADPNLADPFLGETPLHRAVLAGASLELLMMLLEAKADPTRADLAGRTAADVAASWSRSEAEDVLRAAAEV